MADQTVAKKHWVKRGLVIGGVVVVALVAGGYVLLPVVAGRIAPGKIEGAANGAIKGSIKVGSVSLSWGGPTRVQSVELRDPEGGVVGVFDVESGLGIWSALGGLDDLGTTKVSGKMTLVRTVDKNGQGVTNLERAVASKAAAGSGGSASGGTVAAIKGRLEITGIDATYEERGAGGSPSQGVASMKGLKGALEFSTVGVGSLDLTLDAGFAEGGGPSTGSLSVAAKGSGFIDGGVVSAGKSVFDATVKAKGVPVAFVDALAGQGGVLTGALGATADATVTAKSASGVLDADILLTSPNATADVGISSADGRLRATRKGNASLRSLAFVDRIPGVAEGLRGAGLTVNGDGWPGAKVSIESLDVPASAAEAKWSGSKIDVRAFTTGPISGTLTRPGSEAAEPVVVRPATIGVISTDVARGVDLIGDTGATVGGRSAGEVDLNVQASGLVDGEGRLVVMAGGVPGKISGRLEAKGVATELLAPFVAVSGLPVVLASDVGPTVDVVFTASTGGVQAQGTSGGATPPTDLTLSVKSANVSLSSALIYDSSGIGIAGTPTRIVIERAGPLVQRLVSTPTAGNAAAESGPTVRGAGRVEFEVVEARLPISGRKLDFSLATARATATVSDLTLSNAGGRGLDLGAERLSVSLLAIPRTVSTARLDGRVLIDGAPADLRGDVRVTGLLGAQDLPRIGVLGTRRLAGGVTLTGVAGTSLRGLLAGQGSSAELKKLASELVGSDVDVTLDFGEKTVGSGQSLGVKLSGGLNAALAGELRADAVELVSADGRVVLTDGLARAVLEASGQSGGAVSGARLREPTELSVRVQPVTVPLKTGTLDPDLGSGRAMGIVLAQAALSRPAVVDGLLVDGRSMSAGVAGVSFDVQMPLSMLAERDGSAGAVNASAGLRLAASLDVVGDGPSDILAKLRVEGGGGTGNSPVRVTANITEVSTVRLDQILGQGGVLPELLGDKATVVGVLMKPASGPMGLTLDVDSPRMAVKNAQVMASDESLSAAAPFSMTLEAHPSLLSGPGAPAGGARLAQPVKLTLSVAKLTLSAPGEGGGLFRPGVFALDAVASTPRVVLTRTGEGGTTETTEFTEVATTLKSTGGASKVGVAFSAGIGSVRGGGGVVTEPTVIRGSVENIADISGKVQADLAVLNLTAKTGKLPTVVLDALAGTGGQIAEFMGDELAADVEARDVSKTGSSGFVSVKLRSPNASLDAGGPVSGGVWDTGAPGATPLRAQMSEFRFKTGGKVLMVFPIFAEVQRSAASVGTGPGTVASPAVITSRGLRVPIDGDMRKLSGTLDVDIGKVDYVFSQALGGLLDDTIFRGGRGADQRPVPPFVVTIDQGILRYGSVQQKVVLPVRNIDFQTRGVVDLVSNRLEVVTYVPTVAAAPGLLGNLNNTVGDVVGRLVPGVVERVTAVPIRTSGPMSDTKTGYAADVVLNEFKDVLNPGNIIRGIGDLLGGGRKEEPKPAAPSQPRR